MDKTELIKGIIKKFLEQIQNKVYTRSDFVKKYEGDIDIVVSFGYGRLSHVPYIAFVDSGQRIMNGIYPVVTYYRLHNVLFLAYGESVNSDAKVKWGTVCENKPTVQDYANQNGFELNKLTEAKYGEERYYSVFAVGKDNSMLEADIDRLSQDIVNMIDEYRGVLHKNQMSGVSMGGMNLDVLGDVFKHTATSYKYYWALSLLDLVKDGRTMCSIDEAVVGMMVRAWNPAMNGNFINDQDKLYGEIVEIQKILNIGDGDDVREKLLKGLWDKDVKQKIDNFKINVPYRFLSPWIMFVSEADLMSRSQKFENGCPYALLNYVLKMNLSWQDFLKDNCDSLISSVEMKLKEYLNK